MQDNLKLIPCIECGEECMFQVHEEWSTCDFCLEAAYENGDAFVTDIADLLTGKGMSA